MRFKTTVLVVLTYSPSDFWSLFRLKVHQQHVRADGFVTVGVVVVGVPEP
jgi:hypothetical protein